MQGCRHADHGRAPLLSSARTTAYYGPDNTCASKAVVGIVLSEQAPDVARLQKWWSDATDIRTDPKILQQILTFLDQQHIRRIVMVDRIVGCPHE
jgi:hypothetical protein